MYETKKKTKGKEQPKKTLLGKMTYKKDVRQSKSSENKSKSLEVKIKR